MAAAAPMQRANTAKKVRTRTMGRCLVSVRLPSTSQPLCRRSPQEPGRNGPASAPHKAGNAIRSPQMSYRVTGLEPSQFASLFDLSDAELAERGMKRVTADAKPGFPCRVSLEDAEPG